MVTSKAEDMKLWIEKVKESKNHHINFLVVLKAPLLTLWVLHLLITKTDSGTQSPGEEEKRNWPLDCGSQIWASGWSQEGMSSAMSCPAVIGHRQARVQPHVTCSQFLDGRWWPWFESDPFESWILLSDGELHLQNFSLEAHSPSLVLLCFLPDCF